MPALTDQLHRRSPGAKSHATRCASKPILSRAAHGEPVILNLGETWSESLVVQP